MSKNRITINKSVITRASKILECRIRDALNEHFGCPCEFYWITSAFSVLQGNEGGIVIDIYDGKHQNLHAKSKADATALVTLSMQGELKLVVSQKSFNSTNLKTVAVETKTTIRLQ